MTDGKEPIGVIQGSYDGLTKREMFAMAAMQGLCANSGLDVPSNEIANIAVDVADKLIAALNADKK